MSDLRLDRVTKTFSNGLRAIDGLSFHVPSGQTVVILGPSGCGKTTLLRVVAGLETPTEGTVSIDSQVVNSLPPKARDVAMVFQSHALYPHLNVRDNLAFGLTLRKTPRSEIDERVGWVTKLLAIESLLKRMPSELSGGQRQRVALGRAIVRRPKIFLFDEPLSQLDANLRREMRDELKQLLQQLQTTTLYVTHDLEEGRVLADHLCFMHLGQFIYQGPFDEKAGKLP
jgi:sn-glycerol 3-phosphate transport system ATP-binding protein